MKGVFFFGSTIPVVEYEAEAYYGLHAMCDVLGLGTQEIRKLQQHRLLGKEIKMLSLPNENGEQQAWCIRESAIPFWFATIDEERIHTEIQADFVATYLLSVAEEK